MISSALAATVILLAVLLVSMTDRERHQPIGWGYGIALVACWLVLFGSAFMAFSLFGWRLP